VRILPEYCIDFKKGKGFSLSVFLTLILRWQSLAGYFL
jgi:hypothetical protein